MKLRTALLAIFLVIGTVTSMAGRAPAMTAVHPCYASQLSMRFGHSMGTPSTIVYPLIFTNDAGTCTISGTPQIQPVRGKTHRSVGHRAAADVSARPLVLTIMKGQSVTALIGFVITKNYPTSRCGPVSTSGVTVTLARVTRQFLPLPQSVCTKLLSVTTRPIVFGASGA